MQYAVIDFRVDAKKEGFMNAKIYNNLPHPNELSGYEGVYVVHNPRLDKNADFKANDAFNTLLRATIRVALIEEVNRNQKVRSTANGIQVRL
jgi:hypothetical protein